MPCKEVNLRDLRWSSAHDPRWVRPPGRVLVVELDPVRRARISQVYLAQGKPVYEVPSSGEVTKLLRAMPEMFDTVVWGPSCTSDPWADEVEREVNGLGEWPHAVKFVDAVSLV